MSRTIKIIIAVVVLIVLVLIAFFVFRIINSDDDTEQVNENAETTQPEGVELFASGKYSSLALSFSGDTLWFFDAQGNLYRKSLINQEAKKEFEIPPMAGFLRTVWPPAGSDFIVEQNIEGKTRYLLYDAENRDFLPYPNNLRAPEFLSGSDQIVFDWVSDDQKHNLQVADLTSQNFRQVAELFRSDYKIAPSTVSDSVIIYTENRADPSKLFLVDLDTGAFTDLSESAAYQGVKFSPDGTKLLIARWVNQSDALPGLYVVDLADLSEKNTGIFANIEQAAWTSDGESLLIGNPVGIVEYNLIDGSQNIFKSFASDSGQLNPTELIIHPENTSVIFVDQNTGDIYRVDR